MNPLASWSSSPRLTRLTRLARSLLLASLALTALGLCAAPAAAQVPGDVAVEGSVAPPPPAPSPPWTPAAPLPIGAPGATAPCSPCYLTPPTIAGRPLTRAELELLDEGEISTGRHVGGVFAAAYVGFGLGHAIEGRWSERGWVFTVGEPLALALLFHGLQQSFVGACAAADDPSQYLSAPQHGCTSERTSAAEWQIMGGLVGFLVLRTWEIVDSYTGVVDHNRKVRRLREMTGSQVHLAPYLAPTGDGAGGLAGVAARF